MLLLRALLIAGRPGAVRSQDRLREARLLGTLPARAHESGGCGQGAHLFVPTSGLGGCPFAPGATGNIATEELVYLLADCGVATGVDLDAVLDAARLVEKIVGHPGDSNLLRAGGRSVPLR